MIPPGGLLHNYQRALKVKIIDKSRINVALECG